MESGRSERSWRVVGSELRPGLDIPALRGEGCAGLWTDAGCQKLASPATFAANSRSRRETVARTLPSR